MPSRDTVGDRELLLRFPGGKSMRPLLEAKGEDELLPYGLREEILAIESLADLGRFAAR